MARETTLITYADRLGGGGIPLVDEILENELGGVFTGIHLLPFFDPIDGEDAGFDPVAHEKVDPRLGTWADVRQLARSRKVVADLIVNHISSDSAQFQHYKKYRGSSKYADMFLTMDAVFENGIYDARLKQLFRPRPTDPWTPVTLSDGTQVNLWTTFTDKQIDLNLRSEIARDYLLRILDTMAENGIDTVRLDAVGYAVKTAGTSCFMTPETFEFIEELSAWAHARGVKVLAEVHAHYATQLELANYVDQIYDFALPALVLHALFCDDAEPLKEWLRQSPTNTVTVLDTHDGIGVMDVGKGSSADGLPGLLTDRQIDNLVQCIHRNSNGESAAASRSDVRNVDLYQVNCTYYAALASNDRDYLLARLIQLFSPGSPQIYYVGLLAGDNDMALLSATKNGRDINRRLYSRAELREQLRRPVVRHLLNLIRFRATHPAFEGDFELLDSASHIIDIRWSGAGSWLQMSLDLSNRTFCVSDSEGLDARDFDELGI